jgi:hypothetical protein
MYSIQVLTNTPATLNELLPQLSSALTGNQTDNAFKQNKLLSLKFFSAHQL